MSSDGQRFADFCAACIVHTKGVWAGRPLILEEFQREFFDELLSYDPLGRRYYTEAWWLLPRKNGKSSSVSAFCLYMLTSDGEEGAEVYAAAASRDQARVIFRQAQQYVEASPALQDDVIVRRNHIEQLPGRGTGIFRVLSSDAPKQHGLNPSANGIDEIWAHEHPELVTALVSGTGAREQPITLGISTLGWNRQTLLGEIIDRLLKRKAERRPGLTIVRDRESRTLLWWHHAPEDADPDDMAAYKIGNPASWITEEYLRSERRKPSMRLADFTRLHGNLWTAAEEDWLPKGKWAAGLDPSIELLPDLPVAVGIDVALTHDYAAITLAQKQPSADEPRSVVRARFWHNPHEPHTPAHDAWEFEIAELREALREIYTRFPAAAAYKPDTRVPAPGPAFLYDPWKFKESAQILRGEGLNMVEFPQWDRYRVPADTLLYEQIVAERIVHDGDPILAEHLANARGLRRDRGWRIRKPVDAKGREIADKHIDGAVTTSMAVWHASQPAPEPRRRKIGVGF